MGVRLELGHNVRVAAYLDGQREFKFTVFNTTRVVRTTQEFTAAKRTAQTLDQCGIRALEETPVW